MNMRLVDPRTNVLDAGLTVGTAVAMMLEEIRLENKSSETVKWYHQRLGNILSQWWEQDVTKLEQGDFDRLRTEILGEFAPPTANGYIRNVSQRCWRPHGVATWIHNI